MNRSIIRYTLYILLIPVLMLGQSTVKKSGPIIEGYGEVWEINEPDFNTDTMIAYKVIFDINSTPESPTQVSSQINTIARFLNMHANAGIPTQNIEVAAVFHNRASTDILSSVHYKVKHGVNNPNEPLIKLLMDNGVKLYFCGQSSLSRDVPKDKIINGIDVALSAMTVILDHTNKGYTLIKF